MALKSTDMGLPSGNAAAAAAGPRMVTLQAPAAPAPVAVRLNAATTALCICDMTDKIASAQPDRIKKLLPALVALLARARDAGVLVVYSTHAAGASAWLPEVAPLPGDPFVALRGQDRFFDTELDRILGDKGITTLVLTGWKISGSVLYTSVGATLRGYTVVTPLDASSAATDFEIAVGVYQMLTQSSANPDNEPLKPGATTLSRTDLMTFE